MELSAEFQRALEAEVARLTEQGPSRQRIDSAFDTAMNELNQGLQVLRQAKKLPGLDAGALRAIDKALADIAQAGKSLFRAKGIALRQAQ